MSLLILSLSLLLPLKYGVSDLLNDGLTATCISEEYRLGVVSAESRNFDWEASQLTINHMQSCESFNQKKHEQLNDIDASSEYNLAGDSHQSILDLFQVAVSLMELSVNVLDSCALSSMVVLISHLEGIFKKICLIRYTFLFSSLRFLFLHLQRWDY